VVAIALKLTGRVISLLGSGDTLQVVGGKTPTIKGLACEMRQKHKAQGKEPYKATIAPWSAVT